ncbi:calcium channel flower-like isoform X2 [Artemia franciscana]|uniref:Calcium channel flower n=1 Tax=Artemia franciscana TaxID=6661 RepID=A0AA88HUQ1_ARTSF|nr:hypothetical protein QYM36_005635 [Artemia franciscana]KAK2718390.1 hypothetical protein QYM36_005635 [Artemia franciscana]
MNNPEVETAPWYLKYGSRGLGTASGILAMFMGIWACITITPICLVAGIFQIFAGFIITLIEAPCCCQFFDFVTVISTRIEQKPLWYKAVLYVLLALPGISMCPSVSTFLGSVAMVAAGAVYAMLSLGKKASPTEMRANAVAADKPNLVANMEFPSQQVP